MLGVVDRENSLFRIGSVPHQSPRNVEPFEHRHRGLVRVGPFTNEFLGPVNRLVDILWSHREGDPRRCAVRGLLRSVRIELYYLVCEEDPVRHLSAHLEPENPGRAFLLRVRVIDAYDQPLVEGRYDLDLDPSAATDDLIAQILDLLDALGLR